MEVNLKNTGNNTEKHILVKNAIGMFTSELIHV